MPINIGMREAKKDVLIEIYKKLRIIESFLTIRTSEKIEKLQRYSVQKSGT